MVAIFILSLVANSQRVEQFKSEIAAMKKEMAQLQSNADTHFQARKKAEEQLENLLTEKRNLQEQVRELRGLLVSSFYKLTNMGSLQMFRQETSVSIVEFVPFPKESARMPFLNE